MKKLKGYLFVGGVYQDEVKEGKVEVLILNAEKRWTAMSGTLKTENGRMVFDKNDKIKVTKKGKIKITKIGYFFDIEK